LLNIYILLTLLAIIFKCASMFCSAAGRGYAHLSPSRVCSYYSWPDLNSASAHWTNQQHKKCRSRILSNEGNAFPWTRWLVLWMWTCMYMYKETCLFKCGRRRKKINLLHWTLTQQTFGLFEPEKPKEIEQYRMTQ
jgi:hypothetical protein